MAMLRYGEMAFGLHDWERYHWWGLAAAKGWRTHTFNCTVKGFCESFRKGESSRILHTVALVIRTHLDVTKKQVFGEELDDADFSCFVDTLALHDAMLGRAKQAIFCWSVAGRRLGVAKDIRVLIAKMAWEKPWRW
jgi:hypothetical protein